jgi:hypothetical protein
MTVDSIFGQLDATGRTVTSIVLALVGVAAALALLTAWYWRSTDPRRRVDSPPNPPARPLRVPAPGPFDDPHPGGSAKPARTEDRTEVGERSAIHDTADSRSAESTATDRVADDVAASVDDRAGVDDVIDLREASPGDLEGELSFDEWLELADDDS